MKSLQWWFEVVSTVCITHSILDIRRVMPSREWKHHVHDNTYCFGPFPAFKLLPFFVTVCIFRKVFLPQTRKDRATATGWSHDLGVSVCEDWCDHPVVAEVWRFYGFSISRHLIFERRRKTSDAYVGTPLPSFSNPISPSFRCDNSIIAVGLCLFISFLRYW